MTADHTDAEDPQEDGRPPQNLKETLIANSRPQPAIPAVLVFFLAVLMPTMFMAESDPQALWQIGLVALGIIGSCALAIAAGFCSVAPQAIWFALASWALNLDGTGRIAPINETLLTLGMAAVIVMIGVQIWRVRTGQFVPTIRDTVDSQSDW